VLTSKGTNRRIPLSLGAKPGKKHLPVIRYFLFVGSILIVGIWLAGHDATGPVPYRQSGPEKWRALDSLREIAHHGDHAFRSAAMLPHLAAVSQRPLESVRPKPIVSATSPLRNDTRAETDSRTKTMARTQVRKAVAALHRKPLAQARRPANTRIAVSGPAQAFFVDTFSCDRAPFCRSAGHGATAITD
jgi:hypothetical protein